MTQQEAQKLQVGDVVIFNGDTSANMSAVGIKVIHHGQRGLVYQCDAGNDRMYVRMADGKEYWALITVLNPVVIQSDKKAKGAEKKDKATRFSKTEVKEFARQGSNTLLQSELSKRLNNARTHVTNAGVVAFFHKELRLAGEQIRQARLIHAAIVPDAPTK